MIEVLLSAILQELQEIKFYMSEQARPVQAEEAGNWGSCYLTR